MEVQKVNKLIKDVTEKIKIQKDERQYMSDCCLLLASLIWRESPPSVYFIEGYKIAITRVSDFCDFHKKYYKNKDEIN